MGIWAHVQVYSRVWRDIAGRPFGVATRSPVFSSREAAKSAKYKGVWRVSARTTRDACIGKNGLTRRSTLQTGKMLEPRGKAPRRSWDSLEFLVRRKKNHRIRTVRPMNTSMLRVMTLMTVALPSVVNCWPGLNVDLAGRWPLIK